LLESYIKDKKILHNHNHLFEYLKTHKGRCSYIFLW